MIENLMVMHTLVYIMILDSPNANGATVYWYKNNQEALAKR